MNYQYNFLDELIVDYFAGGGGASLGIELATGRIVDIAVNHDPVAIEMHSANHPWTKHYKENVFDIDLGKIVAGRKIGLFWASPDCTHFSRAKGGKPVKKEIRGLAWVILKIASQNRPRVIAMENVPEFVTWGPLDKDNYPDKKRAGQTFNLFVWHLRNLGYSVEWRVLDASDYGAGTSRKRFYFVARCDGQPIIWPQQTHGNKQGLKPKHTAAEYIDFSLRGNSIFNRKKPLAEATQRRIAKGLDKFTIKSKKPFIIPVGYGEAKGQQPRVNDIDNPLGTIVSSTKHNVVNPFLSNLQFNNLGRPADEPLQTQTSGCKDYLLAPHISKYFSGEKQAGSAADEPLSTITAIDHNAAADAVFAPFISSKYGDNGSGNIRGREVDKPLPTTAATTCHSYYIAPNLIQYHSEQKEENARAYGLDEPIKVIDTNPRYGLSTANLVNYYKTGHALDITKPAPVQTTHDRTAYIENHLCVLRNNIDCYSAKEPLRTITAGGGHHYNIKTYLLQYEAGADLDNWPQVRELLNKYAGYSIAENQVLILEIAGTPYFISDIEMRMLTPRELFGCQGFPADYIIDCTADGKLITKTEQVRKVGNSVCPPVATALIRANLPEMCGKPITTMAELEKRVCMA